ELRGMHDRNASTSGPTGMSRPAGPACRRGLHPGGQDRSSKRRRLGVGQAFAGTRERRLPSGLQWKPTGSHEAVGDCIQRKVWTPNIGTNTSARGVVDFSPAPPGSVTTFSQPKRIGPNLDFEIDRDRKLAVMAALKGFVQPPARPSRAV